MEGDPGARSGDIDKGQTVRAADRIIVDDGTLGRIIHVDPAQVLGEFYGATSVVGYPEQPLHPAMEPRRIWKDSRSFEGPDGQRAPEDSFLPPPGPVRD